MMDIEVMNLFAKFDKATGERIIGVEKRLNAVEEKLKAIVRIDVKPTELMKLSKEDRKEIFEWGALTTENAELKKRIDELEAERRENALDGQAELDIRGIEIVRLKAENAELKTSSAGLFETIGKCDDKIKRLEAELDKYKKFFEKANAEVLRNKSNGFEICAMEQRFWQEIKKEAGIE